MTDRSGDGVADRVIVLDIVGLQPRHLREGHAPAIASFLSGSATGLQPPFPAVTVPVQTTMATGTGPATHGDVANGEYDRDRDAVAFWERDREDRTRIWEAVTETTDLTTAALFFQHLIGTSADVAITPSPIEDEDNTLIEMDCWTNPDGFYDDLKDEYGHFPLHSYWGPMAGESATQWILDAAWETVDRYDPDLLWVYVPHLDYDAQRHGPTDPRTQAAVETVDGMVGEFLDRLSGTDRWDRTAVTVVGEYGFHDVDRVVFPNRALREAGLLSVAADGHGGEAVDLEASEAFAMVDHQATHVYADAGAVEPARDALAGLDGVDRVLVGDQRASVGVDHAASGDLVLVADRDAWFQYYWWNDDDDAPHYATEMDIHSKPGYDPAELFPGDDGLVTLDPTQVSGSHGRPDPEARAVFALGGPAAPEIRRDDPVDARAVAPTVAALLGVEEAVDLPFERPPVR